MSASDLSCALLEHHHLAKVSYGDCNVLHTTANCVALLIGLGVLSSPFAIAQGGYSALLPIFFYAFSYFYATFVLDRCLRAHPELSNYQDISTKAFGKKGRFFATSLLFVDLLSALVSYAISLADNLVAVFPDPELGFWALRARNFLMFLATLVLLPTVWLRSFRSLSFLSASSITISILILVTLLWVAFWDSVGTTQTIPLLRWEGLPVASGIFLFSYGANIILPSVRASMIDPGKFPKVLACSFAIAAIFYGGIGLLGAAMFGEETESQITLNMPSSLLASKIALYANIINPLMKFSILLRPIATDLESFLPWHPESKTHLLLALIMRSVLLVGIILISVSLPFFAYVVAFVGSSITVTICMILPFWFYWKIFKPRVKRWEFASFLFLTAVAVSAGAIGTVYSILGIDASASSTLTLFR